MRTEEEIIKEVKHIRKREVDWDGRAQWQLLQVLPYDQAKQFFRKDADITKEEWEQERVPLTEEAVREALRCRVSFAWDKALGHRGISASLNNNALRELMWLLGDDELVAFIDDDANYPMYGVPALWRISKRYKLPIPKDEAVKPMRQGKPCHPDCVWCR